MYFLFSLFWVIHLVACAVSVIYFAVVLVTSIPERQNLRHLNRYECLLFAYAPITSALVLGCLANFIP